MNRRELLTLLGAGAVTVAGIALAPQLAIHAATQPRDWRRAWAHRMQIRTRPLPTSWPMRECSQWMIETDGLAYRHDIAYRNRVTGEERQLAVDFYYVKGMDIPAELERQRVMSRSFFGSWIQRECGLHMIEPSRYFKLQLQLPIGIAQHARYV